MRFSFGKGNFAKAGFYFVFELGRRYFYFCTSYWGKVKLIIWLSHFSFNTIKCFNSSILNLNITFIDRFNNLVTVRLLHHIWTQSMFLMMMIIIIFICSYWKWVLFCVLIISKVWTFVPSQNKTISGIAVFGHSLPNRKAQLFSMANSTFSISPFLVISFPWFEVRRENTFFFFFK